MRITPLDIRKQTFSKGIRGLDADEVHSFLEMVATELETVNKENQERSEKIRIIEAQLETFKKIEDNMQNALLTAQRITDEIKVNAQKEADLITKEAQARAHKEMESARGKVLDLNRELTTLKHQKNMFISRFKSLVNTQMEMLNVLEKDDELSPFEEEASPGNGNGSKPEAKSVLVTNPRTTTPQIAT